MVKWFGFKLNPRLVGVLKTKNNETLKINYYSLLKRDFFQINVSRILLKFSEYLFSRTTLSTSFVYVKRQNFENYILGKLQIRISPAFYFEDWLRSVRTWRQIFAKNDEKIKHINSLSTLPCQRQDIDIFHFDFFGCCKYRFVMDSFIVSWFFPLKCS